MASGIGRRVTKRMRWLFEVEIKDGEAAGTSVLADKLRLARRK